MKIYKVHMCMVLVLSRLKKVNLYQYSATKAIIHISGKDPDDAAHKAYIGLSSLIIKQKPEGEETLRFLTDILNDIRITRIEIDES